MEKTVEKTISFEKHQEIGMICKILNVRLVKRTCEVMNGVDKGK